MSKTYDDNPQIVPEGWNSVPFSATAQFINGRAFKPSEWKTNGLPIIRIQNLNDPGAPFNYFDELVEDEYLVVDGDILLSWSASLGIYVWKRGKAILNQHIFKVIPNGDVDRLYFYYMAHSAVEDLSTRVHGSTMRHFKKGELDAARVLLPPLDEQTRIGSILAAVDDRIQKTEEIIAKNQQLKKGMMQQLLTRGIGHTKFKNTEIGEVPEGWEVTELSDIVVNIKRGPSKSTNTSGKGIIYLTSDYLQDGVVGFENLKYLQFEKHEEIDKYVLRTGDLIVNCVNSLDKVGKVAVFEGYKERVMVGFNNFGLSFDGQVCNAHYLKQLFMTEEYQRLLRNTSKPAVQQVSFSSKDLLRLKVPLPQVVEQDKIVSILSSIDEKNWNERNARKMYEALKKGLMQVLLTGKVRVKVS